MIRLDVTTRTSISANAVHEVSQPAANRDRDARRGVEACSSEGR